ncbi:MAG: hypothetical protein ABIT04_05145 [Novosphingobium sp.]
MIAALSGSIVTNGSKEEDRLMVKPSQPLSVAPSDAVRPLDWRRKMSDNIAYALLAYTVLQIFVTMSALKNEGMSMLPYLALVVLVGAIIPACRRFERRWNRLSDEQASDPLFYRPYRRDRLALWLLAIGLPFALTALFKGLAFAFA